MIWSGTINGVSTTIPSRTPYATEEQCVYAMMDAQHQSDSNRRDLRIRTMTCVRNDYIQNRNLR